jgi:alpha,alpha-trehalase
MENAVLRPACAVEAIDPLTLAPDPGEMAQLYIDVRKTDEYPRGYADGMTLACSVPKIPYPEIRARYMEVRDIPGFDARSFWDGHFDVPNFDQSKITAPDGMGIDEYIQRARPLFIKTAAVSDGSFDYPLPHPYPTAGGRFDRHLFPHDGYQIMKGYAGAGRWEDVINTVDDLEYMINMLGYASNGNSGIYATRFQIPYFSRGVHMLYEKFGEAALVRYLPALEREHEHLMSGQRELSDTRPGMPIAHRSVVHMPDGTFLNRYWDDGTGPRLESYKEDVELGELVVKGLTGVAREIRLHKFYKDMRAGAGSGWDYSSRWFEDGKNIETINTTDIVPIDLNCLMVGSEEMLAEAYAAQARAAELGSVDADAAWMRSAEYKEMAERRKDAINKYHYDPVLKTYRDYNFVQGQQTGVLSSAMGFPLYAGMTDREQTLGVARMLRERFLLDGGIISTLTETGQQWDGERAWASPNWANARGVARMAHKLFQQNVIVEDEFEELITLAEDARKAYMHGVEVPFDLYGIFPEKGNARNPAELAAGGEYEPVKILNMTMETYAALKAWNPRDPYGCLPIGRFVLLAA